MGPRHARCLDEAKAIEVAEAVPLVINIGYKVRGSSPSGFSHCRSSGWRSHASSKGSMLRQCGVEHLNITPLADDTFRTFSRQSAPSLRFASGLAGLGCQQVVISISRPLLVVPALSSQR